MNDRIKRLHQLLEGELSQDNLEDLAREFYSICQDGGSISAFFVLHHVCSQLAAVLDGEVVTVESHRDATNGIGAQINKILTSVEDGSEVPIQELDKLVSLMLRNIALFRAQYG